MVSDDSPSVPRRPSSEQQSLFLPQIVDFAVALTRADKGNIQLLDPGSGALILAASRGFEHSYLDHFARVQTRPNTFCGMALATRRRVIIEDVANSAIFAGTPALDVLLAAEVRAVHSLSIVSRSGRAFGVINTHWRRQYPEADYDPSLLEYLAEETGEFLERDEQSRAPG